MIPFSLMLEEQISEVERVQISKSTTIRHVIHTTSDRFVLPDEKPSRCSHEREGRNHPFMTDKGGGGKNI